MLEDNLPVTYQKMLQLPSISNSSKVGQEIVMMILWSVCDNVVNIISDHPLSLQSLCRLELRQKVDLHHLDHLDLPPKLKQFLMFTDFSVDTGFFDLQFIHKRGLFQMS